MVRGRVASLPIHLKSFIAAVLSKSKEIVTCCFAIRDTRFSWHIFSNRSVVSVISDVCVITEHLKAIVPCSLPGGLFLWPSLGVPNLAGFSFVDRFFFYHLFSKVTLSARAAHFLDTYQQCKASASQKKRSAGPASTQLRRVMVVRAFTSPCATHTNNTKTKTQVYRDAFPRRKGPREKKKGHTRCCIVHITLRYDATAKSSAENAKKEKDEKNPRRRNSARSACVCLCDLPLLKDSLSLFLSHSVSLSRHLPEPRPLCEVERPLPNHANSSDFLLPLSESPLLQKDKLRFVAACFVLWISLCSTAFLSPSGKDLDSPRRSDVPLSAIPPTVIHPGS